MKLLIASLTAAAVAAAALGATASGRATATTLRYVEHDSHFKFVDIAPKGGTQKPPSLGDEFVIGGQLTANGKAAGTTNLVCTVTKAGSKGASVCNGSAVIPGGSITVEGVSNIATDSDTYAVTGGTGRYAGASGIVASSEGRGGADNLVVTLR